MNNRVPRSVDVGFRISTSNKYLLYGIEKILEKIMSCNFNSVSYVKDCYQKNHEVKTAHIFHIIYVDSAFVVNEFKPHSSTVAFCFIMPAKARRHLEKGRSVIYINNSLRIVEQELITAIKALIRPVSLRNRTKIRNRDLTSRQKEILHYFLKGTPVEEIAKEINVAIKTVYSHRRAIYSRLGVRNTAEFYKQKHLIELLYNNEENLITH